SFEHSRAGLVAVDRGADGVGRKTSRGGGEPDPLEAPARLDAFRHPVAFHREEADRGGGRRVLIDGSREEPNQCPSPEKLDHAPRKQASKYLSLPAPKAQAIGVQTIAEPASIAPGEAHPAIKLLAHRRVSELRRGGLRDEATDLGELILSGQDRQRARSAAD